MKCVARGSFENIAYKVFRNTEYDEYITKYYVDGIKFVDGDYFTSDKDDAIGTGESEVKFMWKRISINMIEALIAKEKESITQEEYREALSVYKKDMDAKGFEEYEFHYWDDIKNNPGTALQHIRDVLKSTVCYGGVA